MNKISVIIPTYKEPQYLDLCIESIVKGQSDKQEIIVVVDGTFEINKSVLEKWKQNIKTVVFEENYGLSKATNFGVYNASNEIVLIVNDDNVFPKDWDKILLGEFSNDMVLSPNQIEPYASIFKQFYWYDFGKTPDKFELEMFHMKEPQFRQSIPSTNQGSTLPFMMTKLNYITVGGWDESYPNGNVVDWDFFLKCSLAGFKMNRTFKCNFYHFVSTTFKSPDKKEESQEKELQGYEYFKYKWGKYPKHNPDTNLKSI